MEQTEPTSVTLPKDLKQWAIKYADATGRSLSNLISYVLKKKKEEVQKQKKTAAA